MVMPKRFPATVLIGRTERCRHELLIVELVAKHYRAIPTKFFDWSMLQMIPDHPVQRVNQRAAVSRCTEFNVVPDIPLQFEGERAFFWKRDRAGFPLEIVRYFRPSAIDDHVQTSYHAIIILMLNLYKIQSIDCQIKRRSGVFFAHVPIYAPLKFGKIPSLTSINTNLLKNMKICYGNL